jgi:hypothetical protein
LVEVWRFELQASSTQTAIFAFFDYQTLHIARIFQKIVSFCTLFPLFTCRKILVVVSYVVITFESWKTEKRVSAGKTRNTVKTDITETD